MYKYHRSHYCSFCIIIFIHLVYRKRCTDRGMLENKPKKHFLLYKILIAGLATAGLGDILTSPLVQGFTLFIFYTIFPFDTEKRGNMEKGKTNFEFCAFLTSNPLTPSTIKNVSPPLNRTRIDQLDKSVLY